MTEEEKKIVLALEERIAVADEIDSDFVVLTRGKAKKIVRMIKTRTKVVRCKDCQFYIEGENEVDAWMQCRLHSINTSPEEFCSWAAKKGDKSNA